MTKTELVSYVAGTAWLTKRDAGEAADTVFEAIEKYLKKGERV